MTGKTQLRRAVQKKFASKADKQILIPGLLGAYIGAVWMVSVPGRPSFVYVRVHGNNSEVIEAFNDTVSPILNLAVVLTRDELTPNYYRVLRRDVAKYQDWYTPQIGYHATQHEFGGTGSMGADIVWVQKQQFVPLEVRPVSTSGSTYQCFVDPEYYQWNAGYQFFSGGSTPDLAFLRPGGQLQGLFLGVYMDGNTDSLAYITGTQFTHTPWPDNYRALIPTIPTSVGIPLAGILLTHEMSGINWSQIYDTRPILGNGGMTGSPSGIPDAPSDGTLYGRENAAWVAVTGTGGGGIPDAPSDGSLYGRKNAGWTVVTGTGGGAEVDPLSLHLDQTAPQTFTNLAGGTGLMQVTAGVLGLDTKQYVTGSPWTGMGYVTGTPWTGMGYVTGTPWTGMGYVTGTPWTGMGYITGSPGGDMLKSVYDPNNDGIIGIVQGGTNATGTAAARTNLGLAIGSDVEAFDATLNSIAMLGTAANKTIYTSGTDSWMETPLTAAGRALIDDADAAAQRTTLGLGTAALYGVGLTTGTVAAGEGIREKLIAARTYYVRTDGNDANTGLLNTAGGAFLTIQKAVDTAATLDLSIYNVTIQIADGNYYPTNIILKSLIGAGQVIIQGNAATPTNVNIVPTNEGFTFSAPPGHYYIKDLHIGCGSGWYCICVAGGGCVVDYSNLSFGPAGPAGWQIFVVNGGNVNCLGNYAVDGLANGHIYVSAGGLFNLQGPKTITLNGTPNFYTAFIVAQELGHVLSYSMTFSNSCTGKRYYVDTNAVIQVYGSGANYFPGNAAGTVATGGIYN